MSRDFNRRSKSRPRRRHPADFVGNAEPAKQPFSWWRLIARLGAIIIAFLILGIFFGPSLVSCLLAPVLGIALYEIWYLTFESSA
ncbi:MAG: hypothetical protein JXJ20_03570 [Anaerolineae bacterium]|jgi:hypothetical protein|nr:hypothetical protein [Anaerolineae bacterium]